MQRLPNSNFLILDFCEWLKRVILSRAQYNDIDMWDLLFDEKYDQLLLKKAEEYCNRKGRQKNFISNSTIKKIFNEIMRMYYESDEFQILCDRIRLHKEYYPREYLFHGFHRSFEDFLYTLNDEVPRFFKESYDWGGQHFSPHALVDSLRECYKDSLSKDQERNPILQLMVSSKAIEVEFLEWISQENIGKEAVEKIDLMPVDVFEEYAHRFCVDTGNGVSVKRKLVKIFKKSDPGSLLSKLSRLLPYDNAYRKRNLRYVSQRYLTDKAIYKCVLLPIEADYDKFYELVTTRWTDLNDTSADYLDIYLLFCKLWRVRT